jgi:hypothetical protein
MIGFGSCFWINGHLHAVRQVVNPFAFKRLCSVRRSLRIEEYEE